MTPASSNSQNATEPKQPSNSENVTELKQQSGIYLCKFSEVKSISFY